MAKSQHNLQHCTTLCLCIYLYCTVVLYNICGRAASKTPYWTSLEAGIIYKYIVCCGLQILEKNARLSCTRFSLMKKNMYVPYNMCKGWSMVLKVVDVYVVFINVCRLEHCCSKGIPEPISRQAAVAAFPTYI